jgi:hypothetical protein
MLTFQSNPPIETMDKTISVTDSLREPTIPPFKKGLANSIVRQEKFPGPVNPRKSALPNDPRYHEQEHAVHSSCSLASPPDRSPHWFRFGEIPWRCPRIWIVFSLRIWSCVSKIALQRLDRVTETGLVSNPRLHRGDERAANESPA